MKNKDFSELFVLVLVHMRVETSPVNLIPCCAVLCVVNYVYASGCKIRPQLLSEEIKSLSNHPFSKTGLLDPLIQ